MLTVLTVRNISENFIAIHHEGDLGGSEGMLP